LLKPILLIPFTAAGNHLSTQPVGFRRLLHYYIAFGVPITQKIMWEWGFIVQGQLLEVSSQQPTIKNFAELQIQKSQSSKIHAQYRLPPIL